jgi:predicted ATP-dependent serine protease
MKIDYAVTFDCVTEKRKWRGKCRMCGKRLRRTFSSMKTVNPYNVGPDNMPKTRAEVHQDCIQDVDSQVARANSEGVLCGACEA